MANQVYRGNSEQKLYQVTNNFVGGMNTVDVDEVVASNEFRELVNVDLSKYGMLQNRKGFALYNNLNELLQNALLSDVFKNEILHVEIIRDDINLFDTVSNFETIDEFKSAYRYTSYEFRALIVTKRLNTIDFHDLVVFNDGKPDTDWEHFSNLITHGSDSVFGSTKYIVKPKNITGVKSVRLGNLIFISASEFLENGDFIIKMRYEDNGVIGENNLYIDIINNDRNYYETTPYDVETEGYNLLAANPILNVKRQGTLQNIRGVTLIKQEGTNFYALDNIPTDGQFTALVMHTGEIPISNVAVRVYYYNTLGTLVEYEQNKDYIMTFNDTLADGILTFDFDFAKIERRDVPIQIEFSVVDSGDILTYQTFANTTELNTYYNFEIETKYDDGVENPAPYLFDGAMSPSEFHLWQKLGHYNYKDLGRLYTSKQDPTVLGEFTYFIETVSNIQYVRKNYGTVFARKTYDEWDGVEYYQYNGSTWEASTEASYNTGTFKLNVVNTFDGVTIPNYPENTTTGVVNFLKGITQISNLSKRIPSNIVGVIKIGTNPYVWAGSFLGTASDFEPYDSTESATSNFTLVTQFGVTENLEPIKGLDLTNVKITSMNNNLVIYSGNTLWYSVEGNPNYFPYKNYVQLPLLGNDEIVSINYFRGTYMVFTKERIYRISGYFPDITVTLVNDSIGCIDAGSIRSFNNTLVFLTYDGLYRLKQNYYLEGLENVEKIDDKINNLFQRRGKFESILYKETYLLFVEGESFDTLKYYYNINLPNGYHPFTVDKYAIKPTNLFKVNGEMYSITSQGFYKYDEGYTDFLPNVVLPTTQQYLDSTYRVRIATPNMLFAHPTHDKKFKNMFIKTHTVDNIPLYITTYVNDLLDIDPHKYYTNLTMLGEVEYIIEDLETIETTSDTLGNFELGLSKLGKLEMNVHKIPLSSKGKYIQIIIEQNLPAYFGIQDIGIVYKLNKIRAYQ